MKKILSLVVTVPLLALTACSSKNSAHKNADMKTATPTHHSASKIQAEEEKTTSHTVADNQMKGTDSDVEITRKIRDQITDTDKLSTKAQNITIVTKDNLVTLKGEVDKQEEVKTIMDIARNTASGMKINNQLTVHK